MNKITITINNGDLSNAGALAPWFSMPTTGTMDSPDTIHFSAANGFPAASYTSFLERFTPSFNISAMDNRGAWSERQPPPKKFSMNSFADDLISGITTQYRHPVIGMGHSHGGQITLIAALKRPELFSRLIIIECASLPNPYIDLIYRKIPKALLFKFFPLMRGSEMRKKIWPSRRVFLERYKTHPTFKRFTEKALEEYAQHGLFERGDGQFELVFDPIWESYVFRNIEFMWKFLRKTTHPTLLIRAENSNIYSSAQFQKYNKKLPANVHAIEIPNTSHLLIQEDPTLTAAHITDWLQST